ncbi:MAG: secondary thiamine-phosphate synthase enzyme YjbQ [Mariprofundaceae bacterium]|nr:secondary thiamine-phosphate synthase enzyme YjbQ [Mariprofundaceae bacterium]
MRQLQHQLSVNGHGRGMTDITREIRQWVSASGIKTGLLNLFVRHTSCSLMIQENADPDVLLDVEAFMSRLVPDGDPIFRHRAEGPDDMPAHIRMAITQVSLNIPVAGGRLVLGTWQGVYLYEHRLHPMNRCIQLHLLGE